MPKFASGGKWQQINLAGECFVNQYEKGTMFRMPSGSDYSGFVFFHPNNLVRNSKRIADIESDTWEQCHTILFTEDHPFFLIHRLKDGTEEKITLNVEQFMEQIRKTENVPQYHDDKAYLQNCPMVLRGDKKFVVEKLTWDSAKNKFAKLPINPNASKIEAAKVNDPSTWGTFEQACAALERLKQSGFHGGIGYILTSDTNIVGIDLDLDKNGQLSAQGKEILSMLKGKTYIEHSASGAIHIYGFGVKPGNFSRGLDSSLEMYGSAAGNRALMLTGKVYEGKAVPMANIQAEVDEIYKKYFERPELKTEQRQVTTQSFDQTTVLDKLRNAVNSSKFESLMSGNITAYGGDYSKADLALCSMIAFYTDDVSVIDGIYRQSALYSAVKTNNVTGKLESRAEKWDKPRKGGTTYGQETIALALSRLSKTYTPNKSMEQTSPLTIFKQTDKAVLVKVAPIETPALRKPIWLPKSRIEIDKENRRVIAADSRLIAENNLPRLHIKPQKTK